MQLLGGIFIALVSLNVVAFVLHGGYKSITPLVMWIACHQVALITCCIGQKSIQMSIEAAVTNKLDRTIAQVRYGIGANYCAADPHSNAFLALGFRLFISRYPLAFPLCH